MNKNKTMNKNTSNKANNSRLHNNEAHIGLVWIKK